MTRVWCTDLLRIGHLFPQRWRRRKVHHMENKREKQKDRRKEEREKEKRMNVEEKKEAVSVEQPEHPP